MSIPLTDTFGFTPNKPNIDNRYLANNGQSYTSVSAAETALASRLVASCVGLTVLVADENDPDYPEAKEYWVQPYDNNGVIAYHFVEKGAGTTDYADLDNKPTISDGGQGSVQIPLSGNVKVTASTASGDTAGVTVTPGQSAGEIEMQFTLPKGADGQNGAKGDTGEQGPAGPQGILGKSAFEVWKETTGRTTATEPEYIADLQTKVAKWIPVAYEATAASATIGDTVTFTTAPSNPIDGAIVIMPNAASNATASMMFAVSEDPNTQGVYIYTYIGDLNVDTTGLLGIGDVDGTGLANPLPNALAKAEDVCGFVGNKLAKVSDEVTVSVDERIERQTAAEIKSDGQLDTELSSALNVVDKYNVEDCIYVKVSGYKRSANTSGLLYAFFDTNDTFIRGYQGATGANLDIYDANIPINASYILIGGNTNGQVPILKKGVLPKTQVEDALDSTSTTAALSANKGKELNDRISQIGENGSTAYYPASLYNDITEGYMDSEGNTVAASGYAYVGTFVLPETIVKLDVTGYKTGGNTAGLMYVFCDSNGDIITGSGDTVGTGKQTVSLNSIPNGARYIKVMGYKTSASRANVAVVAVTTTEKMDDYRTIEPDLEYGRIGVGNNTELNGSAFTANLRTCKYIKVYPGSKLLFKTTCDCYMVINRYTSDYQFINYLDAVEMSANVEQEIEVGDTSLIRCNFAKTSSSDTSNIMPKMTLTIKGTIPKDWDLKIENRANGNGVIRIRTIVKTFNPISCEDETNLVQDTQTRNEDFVLLMLPKSYSNTGKPTRLIIYCHGAGVTYDASTAYFPDTDYRPAYWLSEGYALMDCNAGVRGHNPHGVNPGTIQAYITAYKTVVRNYNICTDGVFLGGRSMGGAMSVAISQCKEIPVIANCPVSPVLNTLWWWNYVGATRRANLAADMGFVDYPTGVTAARITDAEWTTMKANSDKMRKYSPLWTCINDLPTDDAVLYNNDFRYYGRTDDDSIFTEVEAEMALYGSLHIKLPPTKIFHNNRDGSVPYQRNGKPFYKAMVNGGTICEVRLFDVTNDVDTINVNNHHAELRSDRILASYTNSRGEVIENVPVAYIEMLMFWQRYEGSVI